MKNLCEFCKTDLKYPKFTSQSRRKHVQLCEKYHSFIINGSVCKICKKKQSKMGFLLYHMESEHSKEIAEMKSKNSGNSAVNNSIPDKGENYTFWKKATNVNKDPSFPVSQALKSKNPNNTSGEKQKQLVLMSQSSSLEPGTLIKCSKCWETFLADKFQEHFKEAHENSDAGSKIGNLNLMPNKSVCRLCGFSDKTKAGNKLDFMAQHYAFGHFKDRVNTEVIPKLPKSVPFKCPDCDFIGIQGPVGIRAGTNLANMGNNLLLHYVSQHGILEKFINEAIATRPENLKLKSKINDSTENHDVKSKINESEHKLPNTESCVLCDFKNEDSNNKLQTMENHYYYHHFQEKIKQIILPTIPKNHPFKCPALACNNVSTSMSNTLRHLFRQHDILKKYINDAMEEKPIAQIRKRKNSRTPSKNKSDNKKQTIEIKVGSGKLYNCTICQQEFTNIRKFMNHSLKTHMHKITNEDDAKEDNVNKLSESKQTADSQNKSISEGESEDVVNQLSKSEQTAVSQKLPLINNDVDDNEEIENKTSKSKQTAVPQKKTINDSEDDDVFKRASDILQKVTAKRKTRSLQVNMEASEKEKSKVS